VIGEKIPGTSYNAAKPEAEMKSLVIYYSESDNTGKLARAIASRLGIEERRIETVKPEEAASYDLIFIGTPVHGYRPNPEVTRFIEAMPRLPGKKAAVFCTMHLFGHSRVIKALRRHLEAKGLVFMGGFCRKGLSRLVANIGPRVFNRGRPSLKDLRDAADFAERVLGSMA
jgi:flavodoxin